MFTYPVFSSGTPLTYLLDSWYSFEDAGPSKFLQSSVPAEVYVTDAFEDTNGTAIAEHTPISDVVGDGWSSGGTSPIISANSLVPNGASGWASIDAGSGYAIEIDCTVTLGAVGEYINIGCRGAQAGGYDNGCFYVTCRDDFITAYLKNTSGTTSEVSSRITGSFVGVPLEIKILVLEESFAVYVNGEYLREGELALSGDFEDSWVWIHFLGSTGEVADFSVKLNSFPLVTDANAAAGGIAKVGTTSLLMGVSTGYARSMYKGHPMTQTSRGVGSWSLGGWFYPTDITSGNGYKSPYSVAGTTATVFTSMRSRYGEHTIEWRGDVNYYNSYTGPDAINNWYHYLTVYDDDTKMGYWYRNGQLEITRDMTAASTTPAEGIQQYLNIGRWCSNDARYFDGYASEFATWSRALTPADVSKLYNNGNGVAYGDF